MNGRYDAIMLVANGIIHDPRVTKEATSLASAGYSVLVIGIQPERAVNGETTDRKEWQMALTQSPPWLSAWLARSRGKKIELLVKGVHVLFANFRMIQIAARNGARVLHAHDLNTLPAAWVLKQFRRCAHVVYDSHELWVEQNPAWPDWFKKIQGQLERLLLRSVSSVITVNEGIRKELRRRYPHLPECHVLENYVPLEREVRPTGTPGPEKTTGNPLRVLYHGGYLPGRGLEVVLEAAERLRGMEIDFYFRGYGPLEQSMKAFIERNALPRVHMLPAIKMKELVREARHFDVGIVPYLPNCRNSELALPNKLFEYMAAGLAVVSSDLPEIRRIHSQAAFGLLYRAGSPDSLAEALKSLCEDRGQLISMRANAVEWIYHQGNWGKVSHRLIEIYDRLGCSPTREKAKEAKHE
ncbi:glycosyltransferase [Heliobacterium undosum]|uniref:Glycosyltransferase n=1 Tax=Heliomicrobium undosum TaxID=121734 RepID=A0A845L4E0_9FIRM|nr:glycosyltransferase family 4 protein [Heliomicrobium undosum]MZP29500.1 glycosyltransferase [Heliomicrobium undosum]